MKPRLRCYGPGSPAQERGGKVAGSCRSLLYGTERARATSETEFATDSLLEGAGFELSVPREIGFVSRLCHWPTCRRRIEGADQ